ncbi:MAG: hypothetical protein KGI37_00410 [Alphaproteobacteria bacterium]|nr:hypothetical protein [Alphaproteobacteria bacterium]
MSHTSMILSALMTIAMLIFIAPNIFALNRGHILRNMALWVAIFLGLALIYKNVGPDSPHPLFALPDAMQNMQPATFKMPVEPAKPVPAGSSTPASPPAAPQETTPASPASSQPK